MTASNTRRLLRKSSRDIPLVYAATWEAQSRISSRKNVQSRDTNQILLDDRHHPWLDRFPRYKIDFSIEQALQEKLQIHVVIERGWPVEFNQHVHIAVFLRLIAC